MKTITYDETKWKLVPITPTVSMLNALHSFHNPYAEMLSVSPQPEQPANKRINFVEYDAITKAVEDVSADTKRVAESYGFTTQPEQPTTGPVCMITNDDAQPVLPVKEARSEPPVLTLSMFATKADYEEALKEQSFEARKSGCWNEIGTRIEGADRIEEMERILAKIASGEIECTSLQDLKRKVTTMARQALNPQKG